MTAVVYSETNYNSQSKYNIQTFHRQIGKLYLYESKLTLKIKFLNYYLLLSEVIKYDLILEYSNDW